MAAKSTDRHRVYTLFKARYHNTKECVIQQKVYSIVYVANPQKLNRTLLRMCKDTLQDCNELTNVTELYSEIF